MRFQITDEKVFLDNDGCGILSLPISFWKQTKNDPKDQLRDAPKREVYLKGTNTYDVMTIRTKKILDKHIDPMINIIKKLREIVT